MTELIAQNSGSTTTEHSQTNANEHQLNRTSCCCISLCLGKDKHGGVRYVALGTLSSKKNSFDEYIQALEKT